MQRQIVTLYIHPMQGGPVTQLQWDVPKLHELLGEGTNADARAKELARQIRRSFPKINPERDWLKLQRIVQNLIMMDRFDGIVLRLDGTIDGGDGETKEEMTKIKDEIKRQHQALQGERQQRIQWQSKAQSYETQVTRLQQSQSTLVGLRADSQRLQEEQRALQSQKAILQENLREAQQQVGAYKIQMESLEREHKTQMENLAQEIKKKSGREQELRNIRRELQNTQTKNEQLESTIRQQSEEIERLQEQNRRQLEMTLVGGNDNKQKAQNGPLIL